MAASNVQKTLVKCGRVVFEICKWTDRHTEMLITILRTPANTKELLAKKQQMC